MRAFVKIRQYILESNQTAKELAELKLQIRYLREDMENLSKDHESYEQHFDDIWHWLNWLTGTRKKRINPETKSGM